MIREKIAKASLKREKVVCSLLLDGMAIRKYISWDRQRFGGYVDFGNGVVHYCLPEAKDALVLMAVCVNGSCKVPLAYFFVNGLDGRERANLKN